MTGSSQLIADLAGKLLGELSSKTRSGTLKGKLPPEVKKRVDSYNMFANLWSNADHDILVLVALAELMDEKAIRPIKRKDENQLQDSYGVNSLSQAATQTAVQRMKQDRNAFHIMQLKCEAMRPMAVALAGRSLMGGPMNASQITLDKLGADQVKKVCEANERALKPILGRLDAIIEVNQKVLDAYQ